MIPYALALKSVGFVLTGNKLMADLLALLRLGFVLYWGKSILVFPSY